MREPAIWWDFDPTLDRSQYVRRLLDCYSRIPTCAGRVRREDQRLAHRLYDQRIPLCLLEAALTLAAARRLYRSEPDDPPLPPIRSLHYILRILDEIRQEAIDPGYIDYVRWKVRKAQHQLEGTQVSLQHPNLPLP